MIFKGVQEGKPYADHGLSQSDWAKIPPRQFRLDQLVTVTAVLALDKLLSEDSTFYGDLFAHVVRYQGNYYLEDGLHRAVRSALRNRTIVHARLLDLDDLSINPQAFSARVAPPETDQSMWSTQTGPIGRVGSTQEPPPAGPPLAAQPRRTRSTRTGAHRRD